MRFGDGIQCSDSKHKRRDHRDAAALSTDAMMSASVRPKERRRTVEVSSAQLSATKRMDDRRLELEQ
jgi:hypothetical protein